MSWNLSAKLQYRASLLYYLFIPQNVYILFFAKMIVLIQMEL